jgi:hypothetical protein
MLHPAFSPPLALQITLHLGDLLTLAGGDKPSKMLIGTRQTSKGKAASVELIVARLETR